MVEVRGVWWEAVVKSVDDFTDVNWSERWTLEGNAAVEVRDCALWVATSSDKTVEQAATLWWHEAVPADVLIEVTAEIVGPAEDNAANVNLFFHAREDDGRPYQFGRSGRYADYHQIPNYIATLTGGFQEGWARLRKNPGFTLLSEDPSERSEVGETYRLRALLAGGVIRYWINDRLVHDVTDPQALPGGHFALRTWRSRVRWSQVRISALRRLEDAPQAVVPLP
jgi:hypothetical protein